MNCMRFWFLVLTLSLLSSVLFAKTTCSIPIEGASAENSLLNERLKKHQKIRTLSFAIDLENLQSDKYNKIQLIFETIQSKKFETTYSRNDRNLMAWKIDFSKSQIFPQLFKNYLNIIQFNSKYYLRLYDNPTEKTMINLVFDSTYCHSKTNPNLLSKGL